MARNVMPNAFTKHAMARPPERASKATAIGIIRATAGSGIWEPPSRVWKISHSEANPLSGGSAVVVFTGGTGAGQTALITSNTSTLLTCSGGVAIAPDATTTYKVNFPDVGTGANMNYNAQFNLTTGTIYDQVGGSGTSTQGYADFWMTVDPGANDVNLGTNNTGYSPEVTAGPQFVDTSRNLVTFANAYLTYTGSSVDAGSVAKGAYNGATTYNPGEVVSDSAAAYYNGATLLYRARTGVAPFSAVEPGVTALWRNSWEFYSLYLLREGSFGGGSACACPTAVTTNLVTWVKAGYAPQNASVKAASDSVAPSNGWMGAVEGITPAGYYRRRLADTEQGMDVAMAGRRR